MSHTHVPFDEEGRVERLNYLIDQYYGMHSGELEDHVAAAYQHIEMAMIEIRHVLSDGVVAEDFDEAIFAPVIVPAELRRLLSPEDVFLVTLGYREHAWHVLYMSPRHEPMYASEEDDVEVWDGQIH